MSEFRPDSIRGFAEDEMQAAIAHIEFLEYTLRERDAEIERLREAIGHVANDSCDCAKGPVGDGPNPGCPVHGEHEWGHRIRAKGSG